MSAQKPSTAKQPSNKKIDQQVEESFPASDPPSFMGGKHIVGAPVERETPAPEACKPKKNPSGNRN